MGLNSFLIEKVLVGSELVNLELEVGNSTFSSLGGKGWIIREAKWFEEGK